MTSVSANWKIVLILAIGLVAAGCQTKAPEEDAVETSPAADTQAAPSGGETYSVVRGDSLWGIAAQSRIYGNPYQWPLIYKANADSISDADLIEPGQVLSIARDSSSSEIDAAVSHAKTRGEWSLGVTEDSDKAYLGR
ncbi:MAG: LysM peptidoglycan-binding domain-containing protein [Acidiferrobacterales bacterium]